MDYLDYRRRSRRESNMPNKKPVIPAPMTALGIKRLAGKGLRAPSTLTSKQIQQLAASVEAHIEPRKKPKS